MNHLARMLVPLLLVGGVCPTPSVARPALPGGAGGPSRTQDPEPEWERLVVPAEEAALAKRKLQALADGPQAALDALRGDIGALEGYVTRHPESQSVTSFREALGRLRVAELELLEGADREAAVRLLGRLLEDSDATLLQPMVRDQVASSAVAARLGGASKQDAAPDEGVRWLVETAMFKNDQNTIELFGPAIAPELEAIALDAQHPAELVRYSLRPLTILAGLDPRRALRVALELAERPGAGWVETIAEHGLHSMWPQSILLDAAGGLAPDPLTLLQHIREVPNITDDQLAGAVLPFLLRGVPHPLVQEIGLQVTPELGNLGRQDLRWWHEVLMQQADPQLRWTGVRFGLDWKSDIEMFERFRGDEHMPVRELLAAKLESLTPKGAPTNARHSRVWSSLLSDPAVEVRRAAYHSLDSRLSRSTFLPLLADDFVELVRRLEENDEQQVASDVLDSIYMGVVHLVSSSERGLPVEVLCRLLPSSVPAVASQAWAALTRQWGNPRILARIAVSLPWAGDQTFAWAGVNQGPTANSINVKFEGLRTQPASDVLDIYAQLVERPEVPTAALAALGTCLNYDGRGALDGLPPERAVAVLRATAERVPQRVATLLRDTIDWRRCASALRSDEPGAGTASRVANWAALQVAGAASEVSLVAILAELRAQLGSDTPGAEPLAWLGAALGRRPSLSLHVLVELAEDETVSDRGLSSFGGPDLSSEALDRDQVLRLLDALEQRASKSPLWLSPSPFAVLREGGLQRMRTDPEAFRPALVGAWAQGDLTGALEAAQRAGSTAAFDIVRRNLLLELSGQDNLTMVEYSLDQLLTVPGEETVAALLDFARTATSGTSRQAALQRLDSLDQIRAYAARLDNPEAPTRESAALEVAALLDDESPQLRAEALRGLATLGAVEYLPRIIPFLKSEHEVEQEAARAALDALHAQAGDGR